MKKTNQTFIAFLNAIIISIVLFILQLLLFYKTENIFLLLTISFIIFIIAWIIISFSIKKIIIAKINPLYKLIQSNSIADKNITSSLKNNSIEVITEDITTKVKNKKKQNQKIPDMEKYRKEFLGNVSHELKTPLFTLQGYIYTLLEGGLEDPSINIKYLERTDKNINRLISIVEDLETISRLASEEIKLEYTNFDITQVIKEIFDNQELRVKKQNITLKLLKPDIPVIVNADKKRVYQILNNLIVNSIYYGKENGETTIKFTDFGELYIIEVIDNGIGIDKKNINRIFERFYRVDKSRSRAQGGTGLGLSIVKHLLGKHNQTINIRSEIGKGTVVAFTLSKAK